MKILEIIKKYNLSTKKKFGQNFLVDELLLDKIVSVACDIKNTNVLEIGAGPGGLTFSILKQNPKKLVSIEIDKDCFNILKTEFNQYNNFEVINKDALKIDEKSFFDNEKINVIANLPYNVGTALLLKWLNNLEIFNSFTLLLQKEVVDRIIAEPCTKDYGRLTVLVQALCNVKKGFDIKPTSFIPAPKVMSSVVNITPKANIQNIDIKKLSDITFILFNQRRKIIKKPIQDLIKNQKLDSKVLDFIDLNKRAEELNVECFIRIQSCYR
ncbi:MAG TPA: 16S rRNA (adenine(1518)-N(6)/adenine(1519)-N(6))-dimethyltransferase RsmA [Rickettsiales bacterium]|nr:16S rRNA (adenine(1518)-N(6)/adenine(1519)-N(6))-dimethyltransferase RsmA [Rickettsiales bacterium]